MINHKKDNTSVEELLYILYYIKEKNKRNFLENAPLMNREAVHHMEDRLDVLERLYEILSNPEQRNKILNEIKNNKL